MRELRTVLAACWLLAFVSGPGVAEDMAYSVTVQGACKAQMIVGWDDCQGAATYTSFKSGKYTFQFTDKYKNVYVFSGAKERQLDLNEMYSNIDAIDSTIDGKKIVDSRAMGGCNTKLSPDGEKFVYIDCAVTNSKSILLKFRMSDITYVERAFAQ